MMVDELVKTMVSFPVGEGDASLVERMHAIKQGDGLYLLDNSPFYAFDISFGDVFLATLNEEELIFSKIFSRGGHSTYRIKLPVGHEHSRFLDSWNELEKLGCTYEGSSSNPERLYSIDIPPGVDVSKVYRIFEAKEHEGIWQFEEAHYFRSK